jgi:hypothetical protein
MMNPRATVRWRVLLAGSAIILTGLLAAIQEPRHADAAAGLPAQLKDSEFWQLITDLSEPTDRYPGNNFTSNEDTFQTVVPNLIKNTKPGGVYFGVAPEQNFSFIAAVRPGIAFIIDIRRQNMIEHLMYKALFEVSVDRAEFVSRLFGRTRPAGIAGDATADALFAAYADAVPDRSLHDATLQMMKDRLVREHGFNLSEDDLKNLEFVYREFVLYGPKLNYYSGQATPANSPTGKPFLNYAELMTSNDGRGVNRGYLANEENFRIVKTLEEKNLIVPLVGDFTGAKTIRATGQYARDHGATISTIYASSVEYVLSDQIRGNTSGVISAGWKKYYDNLAQLPIDSSSTLIRAAVLGGRPGIPVQVAMVLQPVSELLKEFHAGQLNTLEDLMHLSKCGDPKEATLGCQP